MTATVFISYSHKQGEWVYTRLAPAIRASGAAVILDIVDGKPGWSLEAQMRLWADNAAHVVAVLSPDYLASSACQLEWKRARKRDPKFLNGGILVPILREDTPGLPPELQGTGAPLYLDLRKDARSKSDAVLDNTWRQLLEVWRGDLGCVPTRWLDALRDIVRDLRDHKHVSLVANTPVKWLELLREVEHQLAPDSLGMVNVADPENWARPAFLENTLAALGAHTTLDTSGPRSDIVGFSKRVKALPHQRIVFKNLQKLNQFPDFGADLFDALRFHAMDEGRTLTLLVHTAEPLGGLLPRGHMLSMMTAIRVVI